MTMDTKTIISSIKKGQVPLFFHLWKLISQFWAWQKLILTMTPTLQWIQQKAEKTGKQEVKPEMITLPPVENIRLTFISFIIHEFLSFSHDKQF